MQIDGREGAELFCRLLRGQLREASFWPPQPAILMMNRCHDSFLGAIRLKVSIELDWRLVDDPCFEAERF